MNKYNQIILATTLTCLTSSVMAEPLSYTFISANYGIFTADIDGIFEELEGDGISLDGSISIAPNFALTAGYGTLSSDVTVNGSTIGADSEGVSIGALFHTPISKFTDFVIGADLLRTKVDVDIDGTPFGSETSNGSSVFLGVRYMGTDNLELRAFLDRTKFEDADSSTGIGLGAGYYVNKTVSLDFGYAFDSDTDTLTFGATKYF